jgi:hypothetical protein
MFKEFNELNAVDNLFYSPLINLDYFIDLSGSN